MNLLEICLSPGRGGMELYMVRTVLALREKHQVLPVIAPGESLVRQRLEAEGVPCHELRVRVRELPLVAAGRLAALYDREQVDVVHAHFRGDLPVAALAKWRSRRRPRLVYTAQMKVSHNKNDPYHNFVYGQVDTFLAITRQLADLMRTRMHPRLAGRVETLYYGTEAPQPLTREGMANLRAQHGLLPDEFVVGLFGQKFEGKGQHLLIDALAGMARQGLAVRGLLVGPPLHPGIDEELQARVDGAGLTGKVALHGFVEQPQRLMQACDAVVLATYQETFGLVLIEAMSVGTAVVGSNAGGVPEIIEDGQSGLLFETRNAASLQEALTRLYHDRALLERLATAGRDSAAGRFSLEGHYRRLEAFLLGETPVE